MNCLLDQRVAPPVKTTTMRAVLYGGKSHGCMLHAVPDCQLPLDWLSPSGEQYEFASMLTSHPRIAVYALAGEAKTSPAWDSALNEWRRLLSEPGIFEGV